MAVTPAAIHYVATVQDGHGDVAVVKFPSNVADISVEATALSVYFTNSQTLLSALAACMNGKIVREEITFSFNRAQKPAGPLPVYAHVFQNAFLDFGDGQLERTRISIPTPKTSDLKTDQITVNDADANIAPLIAAVEATCLSSSHQFFSEYLGGRLREGKVRRRTNLYNATA